MANYKLSSAADKDFEQLFEYGIDNFGLSKAKSYVDGLIIKFQAIAENPLYYQAVDYIRSGYRRSVYGKHAIYYIISNDCVDIMRILRAENLATAFE
ncbi:type II toxin-antitoxin system RelE/ParE family toxin [Thalassotalea piscium]|uniref:Toxin n=1 Tax=Thalassotalea piscium TaxID=1230533 RepID=A0A7X0NDQ0_9GAMM|nr:type II toxin-antitoxin system RelE/ParE family toxin [Thalassotalea piscium]MBB6541548.1 toxin ParE1/3/4 [Thalassotalea piscium]